MKRVKRGQMYVMEGEQTLGNEHTMQYTDDVLENCTLETCIMLLTNVTPMNLIKKSFIRVWTHGFLFYSVDYTLILSLLTFYF